MPVVSCLDYLWSSATVAMVNQLSQQLLSFQLWPQWRSKWLVCSHFGSTKNKKNLKLLTLEESQGEISKSHQIHWIFSVFFRNPLNYKAFKRSTLLWWRGKRSEEERQRQKNVLIMDCMWEIDSCSICHSFLNETIPGQFIFPRRMLLYMSWLWQLSRKT